MSLEVFFDEPFCKVSYDKENNWILSEWNGYQTVDQIKRALTEGYLKAMQTTNCGIIVVDARSAKGTFTAANDWIANDWMMKALKLGFYLNAQIFSSDIFIKFAMQDLNHKYEKSNLPNFKMLYFDNLETAKEWIQAQRMKI